MAHFLLFTLIGVNFGNIWSFLHLSSRLILNYERLSIVTHMNHGPCPHDIKQYLFLFLLLFHWQSWIKFTIKGFWTTRTKAQALELSLRLFKVSYAIEFSMQMIMFVFWLLKIWCFSCEMSKQAVPLWVFRILFGGAPCTMTCYQKNHELESLPFFVWRHTARQYSKVSKLCILHKRISLVATCSYLFKSYGKLIKRIWIPPIYTWCISPNRLTELFNTFTSRAADIANKKIWQLQWLE